MQENKTMVKDIEAAFRKIVEPFIKYPDHLEVNVFEVDGKVVIEPRAHFADTGKIIGKGRSNFAAVQTLMAIIGDRMGKMIRINNLLPAVVGGNEFLPPFDPQEDWPAQETFQDLKEILTLCLRKEPKIKIFENDNQTTYDIGIPKSEKLPIAAGQLAFALSKVFHAIGKSRGRQIFVMGQEI